MAKVTKEKISPEIQEKDEVIDRIYDRKKAGSVSTGFSILDDISSGLRVDNTIVLAGDTGIGKSLLAMNIAVNVAKSGNKVLYLDLENGENTSITRLLSIWSGLDFNYFEGEDSLDKAKEINREMSDYIEYWDHKSLSTLSGFDKDKFGTLVKYIKAQSHNPDTKPRLVIIDPLQELESEIDTGKLYNEQGKVVVGLKNLSQDLHLTIIICHHLRKVGSSNDRFISDIDDKEPVLYRIPTISDLKGSAKITDSSQQVWTLVRPYKSETREGRSKSRIEILKNREGKMGVIRLYFNEDNLRFEDKPVYSIIPVGTLPYQDLDSMGG